MIPRQVLDTNVVVSALLKPRGPEDQVLRLALAGKADLRVSQTILAEYASVLSRPKLQLQAREVTTALDKLYEASTVVHPEFTLNVCRHEPDNRFLECAEAGASDYLVTGNTRHFPKKYKKIKVVTARQLLELLATMPEVE